MAEVVIARLRGLRDLQLHLGAVVAVIGVAIDAQRLDILAPEHLLESLADRGRAGAGRTGDGDDRVAD
jgi:hypothetical protein